jgi:ABC-2 type transport system permease protein
VNPVITVLLVARRELLERARSAMFVASLVITSLVIAAAILVPSLIEGRPLVVGLVDAPSPALEQMLVAESAGVGLTLTTATYPTVAEGEAALAAGDVAVLVVAVREVVWKAGPTQPLDTVVSAALFRIAVGSRAARLQLDPGAAASLLEPPQLRVRSLEPVEPDLEGRQLVAVAAVVLLFMAIAMFATFVLTGVVEEKSSRVIEVLLARIPPRHLLGGKILGIGLLGFAQVVLMVTVAVAALRISGAGGLELPPLQAGLVFLLVLWFVLGYAFYSTAYGALGALASRTEDAQTATGPLTVVMVAAYLFVFTTIAGGPPWVARLATLLPLTAPMAVPMRAAVGDLVWWEGALAVVLMTAAIYGMVRVAGRLYTGAVLRIGGKVRVRDAWRASRT